MNREIKFRAWDKELEMMVIEPYFFEKVYADKEGGHGDFIEYVYCEDWQDLEDGIHRKCEIMQFTGLLDKNGVPIYEGDIVRILYTDWPSKSFDDHRTIDQYMIDISKVGRIGWVGDRWTVQMPLARYPGEYSLNPIFPGPHGFIEAIGNVHEHPHLLLKDKP